MPNAIKYSTSSETQALKKGNFYIATGDVDKGPTSNSNYWNGISPPSGGYTIYLNKASNGPSIYVADNDAQLISLTNIIAGTSYISATQCLNWFSTQTDKMVLNIDYPTIVTNGLVLNLDAGFTPSYSRSGTTWYDLGPSGSTGTLTNGPTFNSDNGGSIVFDGSDDYVVIDVNSFIRNNAAYTFNCFFYYNGGSSGGAPYNIITTPNSDEDGDGFWQHLKLGASWLWRTEDNISGEYGGEVITPNPFSDNNFYYLTSVVKTNTILYYLNGILLTTINTSFQWSRLRNDRTANLFLGTGYDTRYPMSGRVNFFSLYNRELSATEILQNYLSFMNPKLIFGSNLKIWYDMSAPIATSNVDNQNTIDSSNNLVTLSRVYDLSGNGKHLTQTTKVNQPTFIPNAQNGRPANYNTGGNWYDADATVMRTSYNALTSGARSFFIVLKGAANSAFSWDRDSSHRGSLQLGYSVINGWNDLQQDASVNIGGGNGTTTYVMSYLFDTTQTLLYRNGNLNRSQSNNTYTISTGGSSPFGCWTTAPSSGNQEGYWYEMIYLNKIPTIAEYNAVVSYLGNKWGVSCGNLSNYN